MKAYCVANTVIQTVSAVFVIETNTANTKKKTCKYNKNLNFKTFYLFITNIKRKHKTYLYNTKNCRTKI